MKQINEAEKELNYCGIHCSIDVLGGKWKLLIVASLANGPMNLKAVKRAVPEISDKILVKSLRDLEHHHIIYKVDIDPLTQHFSYALTDYGRTVIPLIKSFYEWGQNHIDSFDNQSVQ